MHLPERIDLSTKKKKIETANIVAARRKNKSDRKVSNGKVLNHREKDWINKALARDKHVRRCFVCDSENHLAARCPQNPGRKQSKLEKNSKKREIITQEEESDYNDMSEDSSVSSNNSEEQPSQKVVKEDFSSGKKTLENPFGGERTKQRRSHHSYLRAEARYPNEMMAHCWNSGDLMLTTGTRRKPGCSPSKNTCSKSLLLSR